MVPKDSKETVGDCYYKR